MSGSDNTTEYNSNKTDTNYDLNVRRLLKDNEHLLFFRETIRKTIEQTINSYSEEKFIETFKDISAIKRKPKIGLKLFEIFKKSTSERSINELDELIEKDNLETLFDTYSHLIEESELETENIGWRPPGNVKLHLRSPFVLQKLKRKEELEAYVISKELEVTALQNELLLKRSKIINIEAELKDIHERSKNSVNQLQEMEEGLKLFFEK